MKTPFPGDRRLESIFLWLMHRITEVFGEHAILKGGMALRLMECPRSTNDIDYVFVPFRSKKEIVENLRKIFEEIPDAQIEIQTHSTSFRANIRLPDQVLQIEANVSLECKTVALSTTPLAKQFNQLGRIIQVMSFDVALAHKLAAWNERRLMRDVYDIYYLFQVLGEKPDPATLRFRLNKIQSRLPKLRNRKQMTMKEFIMELQNEAETVSEDAIRGELGILLKEEELTGLDKLFKMTLNKLSFYLEQVTQ